MARKNVAKPVQHWKWFKSEGVIVKHPHHPQKITVRRQTIEKAAVLKGIPAGFKLIRMVINLKVVDAANPKLEVSVFDPPLEISIRYTKDDLKQAAGKPFQVGYWDGKRWTNCAYDLVETPKQPYLGWLVLKIARWDDPTLVVGT